MSENEVDGGEKAGVLNCPKCGSDQTGKVSAIHAAGTAAVETRTSGMGVGLAPGGKLIPALGSGTTTGVQQTELARQLAPPARLPTVKALLLGVLLIGPVLGVVAFFLAIVLSVWLGWSPDTFAVVSFWLVMLAVQGLTVWLAVRAYRYNRDKWPGLRAEWEEKWYCGRCGGVFVPGEQARQD